MSGRRVGPRRIVVSAAVISAALSVSCDTAKLLAPPPPLRAASASASAIDLEFAEPLDRGSAQDPSRYLAYPTGNAGAPATILQATLIDTLYGRVVRLFVSDPINGFLPDSADYTVQTSGLLTLSGKSTGARSADFRTGLNYGGDLQNLFAGHCSSCHGAARAEGSYRTDSYLALHGGGTNATPNLIAGDPNCLLVVKTKPDNSMFRRGNLTFLDSEMIHNWVVSYQARQ